MKKLLSLGLLALALVAFTPTEVGCKNPNQSAYRVVGTVQVSADAAMTAWGDWVARNHPAAATEQKVKDAYDKYRAALIVVYRAGEALAMVEKLGINSTEPRSRLDIALAAASASLADLVNLVRTFGIKI